MSQVGLNGQSIAQHVTARLKRRRTAPFNLRLAPLIDIIFLLLIFFFVTCQFRPLEQFLPLAFASAAGPASVLSAEPLVLNISSAPSGCRITLSSEESLTISAATAEQDLASFAVEIRRILGRQKRTCSDPIELAFEPTVKWDYVAKIYNALYGLGASDITFRLTE